MNHLQDFHHDKLHSRNWPGKILMMITYPSQAVRGGHDKVYSCDTIIGDSHADSLYSAVIMQQVASNNLSAQSRPMPQILTENKTFRLLKIWYVELIVSNG